MDSLIEAAGVPRITPKGLRHTAQSIGRVVVGDDKVMQERLGHADIGITLSTYTHTVTEQHREAGDRIDEVFAPRTDPVSPLPLPAARNLPADGLVLVRGGTLDGDGLRARRSAGAPPLRRARALGLRRSRRRRRSTASLARCSCATRS